MESKTTTTGTTSETVITYIQVYNLEYEMQRAYDKGICIWVRNDPRLEKNMFTVFVGHFLLGETYTPGKMIHDYLEGLYKE